MTQKEIDKFLADTKVYVNGKSKEIQEKLFDLGYKWCSGNQTKVSCVDDPFLFIYNSREITCSNDMTIFKEHENREITAEQILALELTEPTYRPFKDAEECWQEMLKHQPFGWVSSKNKNVMTFICYISNDSVQIHDGCTFHGWNFNYEEMFDKYIFADGIPFGIKEE